MTSEHGSQFDAAGTSLSNKISTQVEPAGKRVRIALSPGRRIIADDAPDDPVRATEPVTTCETVTAPTVVPEVTPPPPIPSPHDRTPSQAIQGTEKVDPSCTSAHCALGGSTMPTGATCTW
eukprot:6470202-Amphidinium_carterae.1